MQANVNKTGKLVPLHQVLFASFLSENCWMTSHLSLVCLVATKRLTRSNRCIRLQVQQGTPERRAYDRQAARSRRRRRCERNQGVIQPRERSRRAQPWMSLCDPISALDPYPIPLKDSRGGFSHHLTHLPLQRSARFSLDAESAFVGV